MSTQIQFQSFNFQSSAVRVITDPTGEFWFCGKDVCTILGYVNESLTLQKHCKENGVSKRYLTDKMQRKQEAIFINEPNLYRLIIKSRKPEAEPFEAWVFEEVLPQIRKTGHYSQNPQKMLPLAQADLVQIVQAVQQAMPQPKEIYQARNLHEVLPLAFLYNKIAVLAEDFLHLYKFLHQKGHGTMAEICKNHFNALNADTALMNRASCCIQRLTLDLSDEDQDTVRRLCLG